MSTKHYNINYLENTGRFLKNLKEFSYFPFKGICEGIVVDLGCGTGTDVIELANTLDSKVKVIGIDHDSAILGKASLNNSNNNTNVEFVLSEVYTTPLVSDSVSGVRAERLLQHLLKPDELVNEIYRILKKDYPVVLIETDWASLSFYTEYLEIEQKINRYLTKKKVNNGFASRNLTKYLENNNFKNFSLEIFPFILRSLKEANEYLWLEVILKEVADEGYINEQEYSTFLNRLHLMNSNNYFTCFLNVIIVSATKQ